MDATTSAIKALIINHREELDPTLTVEAANELFARWADSHGFEVNQEPEAPSGFEFTTFGSTRHAPEDDDVDAVGLAFDNVNGVVGMLDSTLERVDFEFPIDHHVRLALADLKCGVQHLKVALEGLGWNPEA